MSNLELLSKSIDEVASQIRARAISPVELVKAELEHTQRLGSTVNSFVTLLEEQALQRARDLEAELVSGKYRGPLHGIPFGVKDSITIAGIRTRWTKVLADWTPEETAPAVSRMQDARCRSHPLSPNPPKDVLGDSP